MPFTVSLSYAISGLLNSDLQDMAFIFITVKSYVTSGSVLVFECLNRFVLTEP